jgi:hypothetical protein
MLTKLFLGVALLSSAAMLDPPHVLGLGIGPQILAVGGKIKSTLALDRVLPGLWRR